MILAGDIGGTKSRLAVFKFKNHCFIRGVTETYSSSQYKNLTDIIAVMRSKHQLEITQACFGVPGPVIDGFVKTTNLPWILNEREIATDLKIPHVKLVNDLVATTASIPYLKDTDLLRLHQGNPDTQNHIYGVLAPGTGLGQGFLAKIDNRYHVFASEGGHVDFAPNTELEMRLWYYLKKKYTHVSYERILCGAGLINIYDFLKESGESIEPNSLKDRLIETSDRAALISHCGMTEKIEICCNSLNIFASVLGAQAGNMALSMLATGGIYLGGGISPKLASYLPQSGIIESYLNKGRLSDIVHKVPLNLILDDHAALIGAASLSNIE